MSQLIVTGYAEVDGQAVSATATAEVLDAPPPCPPGGAIEAEFARLLEFTRIAERHFAGFRRELEQFIRREVRDLDGGWPGGGDRA